MSIHHATSQKEPALSSEAEQFTVKYSEHAQTWVLLFSQLLSNPRQNLVRAPRLVQILNDIALNQTKLDSFYVDAAIDAVLYLTPDPQLFKYLFRDISSNQHAQKATTILNEIVVPFISQENSADKIFIKLYQELRHVAQEHNVNSHPSFIHQLFKVK